MARSKPRVTRIPRWAAVIAAAVALATAYPVVRAQQAPVFRSSVDLIAVDVQVVDRDGMPIANLTPDQFEVSIDGQRRRVVSADFVEHVPPQMVNTRTRISGALARNIFPDQTADGPPRLFVLAFDTLSFTSTASRGAANAARRFVNGLEPNDLIGIYAYPAGPKLNPTSDHAAVNAELDRLVGQRTLPYSRFHLTPSEVIDITSEMSRVIVPNLEVEETVEEVANRECGADPRCPPQIRAEATSLATYFEAQVTQSLNNLSRLMEGMASHNGRKTVVLLSAGMATSDRPGGRPDVTGMASRIGEAAAAAGVTLYTLHLDATFQNVFTAESSRMDQLEIPREISVISRWLDEFSGASGGALIRVLQGYGEFAFDRILRETSAYYLLGVEPDDSDRTGATRELRVNVGSRGATVRSRTLVVIPERAG